LAENLTVILKPLFNFKKNIMKRNLILAAIVVCFAACNNSNSSESSKTDSTSNNTGANPTTVHPGGETEVDSARTGTMTQQSENGNGSGTQTNPRGTADSAHNGEK